MALAPLALVMLITNFGLQTDGTSMMDSERADKDKFILPSPHPQSGKSIKNNMHLQ